MNWNRAGLLTSRIRNAAVAFAASAAMLALIACGDPGADALSLVAFGDQGTGDAAQLKVAEAVGSFCAAEGCDAGLLLGDNFYPSGVTSVNDAQWETKFVAMYGGLGFPFYATLGNHDYDDGDFARGRYQVQYGQLDPRWIMPGEYYAADPPPVLLLALGTQRILYGLDAAAQAAEFVKAMETSSAPWRIAFGHHPYLSDGAHGNAGEYDGVPGGGDSVKAFFEDHLCGAVDLFLAGHDHDLEVLDGPPACPGVFVVSGGGGAATRGLSDRNGALSRFGASVHGFAHLKITSTKVRLRMIDAEGAVLYDEMVLP